MKVGLDWDGTVSLDPAAFKKVVMAFLDAGHDVAVVTWRTPPGECGAGNSWPDFDEVFEEWGFWLPIIFCSGRAKREFYDADIWIEDNPAAVLFSLTREPRFESDATKYYSDVLICEHEGLTPIKAPWLMLRAKGVKYHG